MSLQEVSGGGGGEHPPYSLWLIISVLPSFSADKELAGKAQASLSVYFLLAIFL